MILMLLRGRSEGKPLKQGVAAIAHMHLKAQLTTPPKPSILLAEKPGPAPAREMALRAGSLGENSLPGRFFSSEGWKKALFTPFTRVDTAPGGLVSGEP